MRPIPTNSRARRSASTAHDATDTDELKGKKISLYVDHEVSFGGKTTGGIRVRATAPDEIGF